MIFKKMYDEVEVVLDQPACHVWRLLHKHFPEAKIILTVRDSEDVWIESYLREEFYNGIIMTCTSTAVAGMNQYSCCRHVPVQLL